MNLENIKEKIALNVQERANLELEKIKLRKAEKEAVLLNKRRERAKLQTQIDHEAYLEKQQRLQDQKEYEKSPEGRTQRSLQQANENLRRWKTKFTREEIELKKLDSKSRIDYNNLKTQGEVRDIWDFLKKKRLKEEQSDRKRRKLKGL